MTVKVDNFGFTRWNFQFEIDGSVTLDPDKSHGLLRRIAGRKRLFLEPMIRSGFLKGKRILDLGCNSGYWSYASLIEGGAAHVTGIDASPELVKQANFVFEKKGVDRVSYHFLLGDAYRFLESSKHSFDVILCLGFFYHINDPMRLLSLMHAASTDVTVIDTIVHKSAEAIISVRPVQKKFVIDEANITLELVSSRKAIFWMAEEVGFMTTRVLKDQYEKVASMWDYIAEQRECFVLSKKSDIESIWANSVNPEYLSIQEDLKKFGYFPEMKKNGRDGN
jgi:2-polyprenyl-3-methyl-5-hydroxy-6-metoxy-1,4-benzoquinol methylase